MNSAFQSTASPPLHATSPLLGGMPAQGYQQDSESQDDRHQFAKNASRGAVSRTNDRFRRSPIIPVSPSRVLLVLNQLAVMTQNGIELADALANVARHCNDERLTRSLVRIHEAVSGGNTFSAAVATCGDYFPPTLSPMLAAAEATGEVPETLGKVCERMRGELDMRGTLVGAMIYPAILIAASTIVLSALVLGVLPQFSKVFGSMGRPIPASTQILLSFGDLCRANWYWVVPSITAAMLGLFSIRHQPIVRQPIGKLLMYGPFIRDAYRLLTAGRNFRTIAAMVRGGVPLMQSIQLARHATRDAYWQKLLLQIEDNLIDGLKASSALTNVDFLPPEAAQMMATGERTGRVGEVLEDIGSFYEQEGGRKLKRLVVAFEPFIILCMGVVVAGIVMSIMLPLLDVSTISR
ncbi:type II secretion system F family protein [Planctomycetes bacterium K23_9]|uniref:Type II secretion system protein F n=1 Tax=Stieleria marina TaxID=1930275 RepID=A0A517NSC9_9BACT|nr:Type II secretion system protein F [Planctomycetes bacterium K23_9]